MKIKKITEIYQAEGTFEERTIPKAAGFWWHGGNCFQSCLACKNKLGKVWWTPKIDIAAKLNQFADESCKTELAAFATKKEVALQQSAATTAQVDIPHPEGLEYLPFQKAGIQYASTREATLIADEMGLGKTIQALGVINLDPTIKTVLVICPATLRLNWQREAQKWLTREFAFHIVNGTEIPKEATFVICNYDKLTGKNGKLVTSELMSRDWDIVIADECHKVKNPDAARTKALLGSWE